MTINKFQGKTESEAIDKAKREMGPEVVIMSVKTVKPKGVFRAFKGIIYEVTAALEENESDKSVKAETAFRQPEAAMKQPESISLAADEPIRIPVAGCRTESGGRTAAEGTSAGQAAGTGVCPGSTCTGACQCDRRAVGQPAESVRRPHLCRKEKSGGWHKRAG